MSLNKKLLSALILSFLFFYSCSEKKQEANQDELNKNYSNPSYVLTQAKNILGNDVKETFKGRFDRDSVIEVIAGTETSNKTQWGIRFYFLKMKNGELTKIWQTDLLQGSFKGSLCDKIKFPYFDHELVYYNSKDYFLGSGGGEVFTYIINFQDYKTYYAHLVDERGKPVSLFVSDNIDVPEIHNFFVGIFKKDYPALKLVDKDIQLRY